MGLNEKIILTCSSQAQGNLPNVQNVRVKWVFYILETRISWVGQTIQKQYKKTNTDEHGGRHHHLRARHNHQGSCHHYQPFLSQSVFFQSVIIQIVFLQNVPDLRVF